MRPENCRLCDRRARYSVEARHGRRDYSCEEHLAEVVETLDEYDHDTEGGLTVHVIKS